MKLVGYEVNIFRYDFRGVPLRIMTAKHKYGATFTYNDVYQRYSLFPPFYWGGYSYPAYEIVEIYDADLEPQPQILRKRAFDL